MKLFSNDSPVGIFFGHLGDIIITNLLFVVTCIPIITIGAALSGMNYAFLKRRRGSSESILRLYFDGFKDNFKQSAIAWIILLPCILFLAGDFAATAAGGIMENRILHIVFAVMLVLVFFVSLWVFVLIPSFENTLKALFLQSIMFASSHLVITLALALTYGMCFFILTSSTFCLLFFGSMLIIFGFGLISWLASFAFIHAISPYLD